MQDLPRDRAGKHGLAKRQIGGRMLNRTSGDTDSGYFRYIPESRLCRTLGCTLQSSGFTRVGSHAQYPARNHPDGHFFDFRRGRILQAYQIIYISEGKGKIELGRGSKQQTIHGGQVFVLFPNVWHRYAPDPITGWTEHWVECKGNAFEMAEKTGLLDVNRPLFRSPETRKIDRIFAEIHALAKEDAVGHQPEISMLALKLLAILAGPRTANEDSTTRVINSVRMLLLESATDNRPMEHIADQLNVSYSNLRRTFRQQTGMSMKDFQLSVRIQKAKDLLDNSDLSIKAVAAQLGFNSAFHFSNQFRRAVGCPPSEWRTRQMEAPSTPE